MSETPRTWIVEAILMKNDSLRRLKGLEIFRTSRGTLYRMPWVRLVQIYWELTLLLEPNCSDGEGGYLGPLGDFQPPGFNGSSIQSSVKRVED